MAHVFKTRENKCPYCDHLLDAARGVSDEDDRAPDEGDCSVCVKCENWLVYGKDQELQAMTEEDIQALDEERFQSMSRATKAIALLKKLKVKEEGE